MILKSKAGILNIVLDSECTIAETEDDFEKLKNIDELPKKIELITDKIQEIDTAYFQMLLSIKAWAEQNKIPFTISETSTSIEEISELYGIKL